VACSIAYALVILGTTAVNVALPDIRESLGGSTSGLQWVANGYLLMLASLLLGMGTLCDVLGARRLMLGGVVVFAAGGALAAAAPNLGVLIGAQIVLGAGAAALAPASLALITHAYDDHAARRHAIGIWASVSAAAVAAGPVVGGLLIGLTGWQAIFAIDVPVALAIGWLALRWIDETPRHPRGVDLPGQVAAIAGLATLTFGLIEAGTHGWLSPLVLGALGGAAAILGCFVWIERRSAAPMLPLGLFAARSFSGGVAVGTLFSFAVYGQLFVLSLYLQEQRGLSALQTGLVFLAQPATYALFAVRASRFSPRGGVRTAMAIGSALTLLGTILLLAVGDHTSYAVIVVAFVISGLGGALAIPVLTTAVVSGVERSQVGIAAAALNAFRNTGGVLGIAVVGGMVAGRSLVDGLHLAVGTSAAALAVAVAVSVLFVSPRPGSQWQEATPAEV
jgi:DHA2 family methylenomycin A resistance protein-like MFS transporter